VSNKTNSKNSEGPIIFGLGLNSAIFLALIPATAYLIVLLFNSGYSRFFHLDSTLLKPDAFSLFHICGSIFITSLVLLRDFDFHLAHILRAVSAFCVYLCVGYAIAIFFSKHFRVETDLKLRGYRRISVLIPVTFALVAFSFTLSIFPGVVAALVTWFFTNNSSKKITTSAYVEAWSHNAFVTARQVCALAVALAPVLYLGYESAELKPYFLISSDASTGVVSDTSTRAVIAISGDYAITSPAQYDKAGELTLTPKFKILGLGETSSSEFTLMRFQSVKVEKSSCAVWETCTEMPDFLDDFFML
jgi:hypothetical protein